MLTLRNLRRAVCLGALALASMSCAAETDESEPEPSGVAAPGDAVSGVMQQLGRAQAIPDALKVPEGARFAFALRARGVQIYSCKAAGEGLFAWTFVEPDAKLSWFGLPAGHHYAGPTWESFDGSTVVAKRVAGESVDATAIPWLLLQATANTGKGFMSKITYVQRIDTIGGNAPAAGCDAGHEGASLEVPYTAKYTFYR